MSNGEHGCYTPRPSRRRSRTPKSSPQTHPETFEERTIRLMPADMRINIVKYVSWLPANVNIMYMNPFDFLQLHHIYTSDSNEWSWQNDTWWFHDKLIEPHIYHRLDFRLENIQEAGPAQHRDSFQQWQLGIFTQK